MHKCTYIHIHTITYMHIYLAYMQKYMPDKTVHLLRSISVYLKNYVCACLYKFQFHHQSACMCVVFYLYLLQIRGCD
jgi:hypothetical protein